MSNFSVLFCFLIVATLHCTSLQAGRTSGRSSGYNQRRGGGYFMDQQSSVTQDTEQTPKEYLDTKSGFSTFGIISIIFAAIVCCLVFYYGIMCYPFLCRDEKKYRFMDVSSTITAATSSSIQSMEILPADQKH